MATSLGESQHWIQNQLSKIQEVTLQPWLAIFLELVTRQKIYIFWAIHGKVLTQRKGTMTEILKSYELHRESEKSANQVRLLAEFVMFTKVGKTWIILYSYYNGHIETLQPWLAIFLEKVTQCNPAAWVTCGEILAQRKCTMTKNFFYVIQRK